MSHRISCMLACTLLLAACDAKEIASVAKRVAEVAEEVAAEEGTTAAQLVDAPQPVVEAAEPFEPPGGQVQIYDKGLRMVRSTITLPRGWRLYQDIATNPNNGETQQFLVDYYGPNGVHLRSMGNSMYYAPSGKSFTKSWRSQITRSLSGVATDVKLGKPEPNDMVERLPNLKQILGKTRVETFDAPFSAIRDGEPVAGRAFVLHIPVSRNPAMGTYVASFVMAPPEHLDWAVETMYEISRTDEVSPEFMAKSAEIGRRNQARSQQAMAQSQRAHQQRMRSRQAAFDAHQGRMKSQSAAFDRANQTWLNNFRGSSSGYDGQAAVVDAIHERQTFRDPSTGGNVARDGVYRYNFSDGRGNFLGTDDANFQPGGDWQAAEALSP